ncbi:hypothetical protein [Bacillus sp. FJAT-44742]
MRKKPNQNNAKVKGKEEKKVGYGDKKLEGPNRPAE